MNAITPSAPLDFLELWRVPTPWGEFAAAMASEGALAVLAFPARDAKAASGSARRSAMAGHPKASFTEQGALPPDAPLRRQLLEFTKGTRRNFDLALALGRRSDFDLAVWRAAAAIRYGERRSYGELSRAIGRPNASRAVGGALGLNPVPLVIPCHRVVRADGAIGGFSGGAGWKERLLEFEGETTSQPRNTQKTRKGQRTNELKRAGLSR
ncbi:MAG: methylated-DNA--[protein]-cysteine S-methyltransferase [Candidatus Sumerlaeota bacterium]|nr:methylated-DNA--[protein]-cysteine S-methyltransferase [Candidatus Sumerlaeota bacterium]